jgi:hypothetical protein
MVLTGIEASNDTGDASQKVRLVVIRPSLLLIVPLLFAGWRGDAVDAHKRAEQGFSMEAEPCPTFQAITGFGEVLCPAECCANMANVNSA